MKKTTLSELVKHKGKLVSPWVDRLGDMLTLTSWSVERLPEYIWMALILDNMGRSDGLRCCIRILEKILAWDSNIDSAQFARFLLLSENNQNDLFEIIKSEVDAMVLAPLTAVIDYEYSPSFYKQFYVSGFDLEKRIEVLNCCTRKYIESDSNDTTDLRFLAVIPKMLSGHLHFEYNSPMTDALLYYTQKSHSDEIMRLYRPCIRSLEGALDLPKRQISSWTEDFWRVTAQATDCKLFSIEYSKDDADMDYSLFIEKTKEAINYLNMQHKQASANDDAYSVLTGSLIYAFKTFSEVVNHDLANTLMGRQAVRIVIEIYIMMKYLISQEYENPAIWGEYRTYGIGKYRMILMKKREGMGREIQHVSEKMLDLLVNEPQLEEFTDVDLRYFDDIKIRDKAISVGEKDLYDVAYDYDSSYAHGLWGAVRESCMLACDNVFHHFQPVADATLSQNLPDVTTDCYNILIKTLLLVNERYCFPAWYISFLGIENE